MYEKPTMIDLPNVGVMIGRLPQNIFTQLKSDIEEIEKDFQKAKSHNSMLAGHLKHQYSLTKDKKCFAQIENFLINDFLEKYLNRYDFFDKGKFHLYSLWVNFQQKYEFNPIHDHSGLISFNIWIKIPYDLEKEKNVFERNKDGPRNSMFEFYYIDTIGRIRVMTMPIDKDYEGVLVMFPAGLKHGVNPFYTSDDYRISVAGNIFPGDKL